MYATFAEEKKLWKKGYSIVAGIDEVGRGPLAGPVVAGAVTVLDFGFRIFKLRDSKKLSQKQREKFYEILARHPNIGWGIGIVSEKVIDRINIYQATKMAMERAIKNLEKSIKSYDRGFSYFIDFLIIDGNMTLGKIKIPQKAIVKGDEKVFSCAAASIIAKVTRDRIMLRFHKKYPQYGFDKHKGYGTSLHLKRLRQYGPCKIHRRSFAPLKSEIRNSKHETNSNDQNPKRVSDFEFRISDFPLLQKL